MLSPHQNPDYEYSEMVLYEAQLLSEADKPDDALRHISEFRDQICDDRAVKEMLGEQQHIYHTLTHTDILAVSNPHILTLTSTPHPH